MATATIGPNWWENPGIRNALGNAVSDLGYGLATSRRPGNAFQAAAQRADQLDPSRQTYALAQQDKAKREASLQSAIENIRTKYGQADVADWLADTGPDGIDAAWNEVLKRRTPGYGELDPTSNMRDFNFAQQNPGYAEFLNPPKAGGLTEVSQGATLYDPASGKAVFTAPVSARPAGAPSATLQKEIFETDEGVQAGENVLKALDTALSLNDKAWDGPMADVASQGGALFGNQEAVDTQTLKNIVTANALESLRSTFGGNPTEGERKILLDIQGSITQPKAVREAIFKRARAAAERRLQFNQNKAGSLRDGSYFGDGYSPSAGDIGSGDPELDQLLQQYGN
jgi:hypothetical protein